jgi:Methyltransferase domain
MPKVMIARIARGCTERTEIGTWLCNCLADPSQTLKGLDVIDIEPTPAARNRAVMRARAQGYGPDDILIQVDDDMAPHGLFYPRAVQFLSERPGPTMFGSPYRGGFPRRAVQALDTTYRRYTEAEAADMRHIQQAGLMGTGLFACTMAAFAAVQEAGRLPWFEYLYADPPFNSMIRSSEDMVFCDKLNHSGGTIFCDWESWSGHAKTEVVGKPQPEGSAGEPACAGRQKLYLQMVSDLPNGAAFAEVAPDDNSLLVPCLEAQRLGKCLRFVEVGARHPDFSGGMVEAIQGDPVKVAERLDDDTFDFVFLCSPADYDATRAEILAWLPKLRPGGMMAGHDRRHLPEVNRAVIDTLNSVGTFEDCWVYERPTVAGNGTAGRKAVAHA